MSTENLFSNLFVFVYHRISSIACYYVPQLIVRFWLLHISYVIYIYMSLFVVFFSSISFFSTNEVLRLWSESPLFDIAFCHIT